MAIEYDKNKMADAGYDLDFIARTQPEGNFKVRPGYIQQGNTFIAYVDVYKYPRTDLPLFWLSGILNNSEVDAISFLSIGTVNSQKVRNAFNSSINELNSRLQDKNMSAATKVDAIDEGKELYDMFRGITKGSDSLKSINLRIMVYAPSLDKLYRNIDTLRDICYSYSMTRFIDEQEYDYRSMLMSYSTQLEKLPKRSNIPKVLAYDLGAGYPFDYTSLDDEAGTYFGHTQTMGKFALNPYSTKGNRTCSFSLIAGSTGQGKSTFVKMLNDDAFMRGNNICNFDVNGEFISNTKDQYGLIIDTEDKGNRINIFEVFPTVTDHTGTKTDTISSFNQNISKIKTIAHIMNPDLTNTDLGLLDSLISDFYIHDGMWFNNPKEHLDELNILNLPHNQYPRLDDFVHYIQNQAEIRNDSSSQKSLEQIILTFENMEKRWSDVFDNYTSDNLDDLIGQKVIDFDMSNIKSQSMGADSRVFQAQFFNYLSLVSSQVVSNGKLMRNKISNGEIDDDKLGMNVNYYYINIDEAQNYFDKDAPDVTNALANMMEEMRKNFCAITLTFPTLEDILPSSDNATTSNERAYQKAIGKIFGLFQYHHFFKLPSKDIDRLKNVFKKSSSISPEQLDAINNLEQYQLVTIIDGGTSYQWETELTSNQLELYSNQSF